MGCLSRAWASTRPEKVRDLCRLFDPLTREANHAPMVSFGAALGADGTMMLIVWNGCHADWKMAKGHPISFQCRGR